MLICCVIGNDKLSIEQDWEANYIEAQLDQQQQLEIKLLDSFEIFLTSPFFHGDKTFAAWVWPFS